MDTSRQLYEGEATGWQRGLYDDIKATFRAPFINWIFRTTMSNYPEFLRYAWTQVKPVFQTERFGHFSVGYRHAVLLAVEEGTATVPAYRSSDADLTAAEFAELRGQLATFDIVAPRLAILFEVIDRGLNGETIGSEPSNRRGATAPCPDWLDADRGTPPSLIPFSQFPAEISEAAATLQQFHGIDEGLPSIYRCLAQWPSYFTTAVGDLEPLLRSQQFSNAVEAANRAVTDHVDGIPHTPMLRPAHLSEHGFSQTLVTDVQEVFREFNAGSIEAVVPAIHVFAKTVDVEGRRTIMDG